MSIINVLIIVTSFNGAGTENSTGLWLEEFAVPYIAFKEQGYHIDVASVKGGKAPIDPRSAPNPQQKSDWSLAISMLENTKELLDVEVSQYDAVFIPGGHGTMFDFPSSKEVQEVLGQFAEQDKIIAAMCHGPAAFVGVTLANGKPLVSGRKLTSFTDEEEAAAGQTEKMPFLLESKLRELGAIFVNNENWANHVEIDGNLITGQNPQSSKSTALAVIKALKE